jgi:hypothetical protein
MLFLTPGYETVVRGKLGLDDIDLTDADINNARFPSIAEAVVAKRVPAYSSITDTVELFYLEEAAINYICYLICPTLPRKLNIEVKTLDTTWKKEKIDWEKLANHFLTEFDKAIGNIESVEIVGSSPVISGIISNDYNPIGGE